MSLSNAWSSAQQPRLVSGPVQQHTAPSAKEREAQDLAALVAAHIAAGGRFEKLAANDVPERARRVLGDLIDSED